MHRRITTALLTLAFVPLFGCGEQAFDRQTQSQALGGPAAGPGDDACERAAMAAKVSKPHKVTICHIPPGNPDNAHTINISKKAVRAHMAHGDDLGGCGCGDAETPDDDRPPADAPPPTDQPPQPAPDEPTTIDTTPDGSTEPPSDGSAGLCDADQGGCGNDGQCLTQQACDVTSGCCVDVFL